MKNIVTRAWEKVILCSALVLFMLGSALLDISFGYYTWFEKEESDLPYVFNALDSSFPHYPQDQEMAIRWNIYSDVFRTCTQRYVPLYNNSRSDQVGLLTDNQYNSYFGKTGGWQGDASIMREILFGLIESDKYLDIAYNDSVTWTTSKSGCCSLFQGSALHELGHALGLHHNFYAMSVMNYNHPMEIEDHLMPDDVRYLYDKFPSFAKNVTDVGVWAYYVPPYPDYYQNFWATDVTPSTVIAGSMITVDTIYIGNLSNTSQPGVKVEFYLSKDKNISQWGEDIYLGYKWATRPLPRAYGSNYDNINLTIPSNVTPGTYYVGMLILADGVNEDIILYNNTAFVEWPITVKSPFDYSLSNNGNITVTQGASNSNTITRTLVSGTTQPVTLSASGLPSGASASFTNNPCNPTCPSTLTISTSASTPTGSYTITVTGTPLSKTTQFSLIVNPQGGTPDFVVTSITLEPPLPLAGSTFEASVTVENRGTAPGDGGLLTVWVNQSSAKGCGAMGDSYTAVGTLAAGESTTVNFTDLPAGSAGQKIFRAFVDATCIITEQDEENNQHTKVHSVQ